MHDPPSSPRQTALHGNPATKTGVSGIRLPYDRPLSVQAEFGHRAVRRGTGSRRHTNLEEEGSLTISEWKLKRATSTGPAKGFRSDAGE
jgi:hypothetical protein